MQRLTSLSLALFLVFSSHVISSECANILFYIGFGGASHRIGMEPLVNALTDKGHKITFLLPEAPKQKDPRIEYFVPQKLAEYLNIRMNSDQRVDFYQVRKQNRIALTWLTIPYFGMEICENLYQDPEYIQWMENSKFDLVVADALFNECSFGLAYVKNAKMIIFSVSSVLPWAIEGFGIPDESSTIPEMMFHFPSEMNFFQRLVTSITPVFWKLFREYVYFPRLRDATMKGLARTEFPSFSDLEKDISLTFVNTHYSQEYVRSLPPNVIPIGGISWVDKRKPLPKKMEDFINKGKEGFIYVSFGSFVDFSMFPNETKQTFINDLKRFPNIQFIWKINETPENLPDHIYVDKWMPQQDILLHPKIRLFLTHSGIGGINEAIFSAVPMVCFPFFAEQDYNAQLIQEKQLGVKLEITDLKEGQVENAIQKILKDDTYRHNMKEMNKRFTDRPMKPVDTALWWTEYVLRHDTTNFLRPRSADQSWWVKRQLDVWLVIMLSMISTAFIFYKLVAFALSKLCGSSTPKKSKKKQKQQ